MIKVKNMNLCFDDVVIFEDTNIKIKRGKYLLTGENKCGKTTFMRLIYNQFDITDGDGTLQAKARVNGSILIYSSYMKVPLELNEIEFMHLIMRMNNFNDAIDYQPIYKNKVLSEYSDLELKEVKLKILFLLDPDILLLDEPFDRDDQFDNVEIVEKIINRSDDKLTIVTTSLDDYQRLFARKIIIENRSINLR